MKKTWISLVAVVALLLSVLCVFGVSAEETSVPVTPEVTWKNGNMSLADTEATSAFGYGFTQIDVTDARGSMDLPNLDEKPYYMLLGQNALMPSGAEAEGGRWAQLHISAGERNINWNPADELYIKFPNAGASPRYLTVGSSVDGAAALPGVPFAVQTAYLFKFTKEKDSNQNDVLVVYCNGTKVFEGADQLAIFEDDPNTTDDDKLWFITLGNIGANDVYQTCPLLIDASVEIEKEPETYFYSGPKWGFDRFCTPPQRDIFVTYTTTGEARWVLMSRYNNDLDPVDQRYGQSVAGKFANTQHRFEVHLTQEVFNYETFQVIGFRPNGEEGSPMDEPDVLFLELVNGPSLQMRYRAPEGGENEELIPLIRFEENEDVKIRFELTTDEAGKEVVLFYVDDWLQHTSTNPDIITLMKANEIHMIAVGHNIVGVNNETLLSVDNNPPEEVIPPEPDDDEEEEDDPYADKVLTSTDEKVTIEGTLISLSSVMTADQLQQALTATDGCLFYIMTADEELADGGDIIDSTYSIMLILDDGFETYVRSYSIYAPAGDGNSQGNPNPPTGVTVQLWLPVMLLMVSAVALTIFKKVRV